MTHNEETSVQQHTEQWLHLTFSPRVVTAEHVLPTDRRVDFFVKTPLGAIVVEVENDLDSATQSQVQFYHGHDPRWYLPVLVLDESHASDQPVEFEAVVTSVAQAGGYVVTIPTDSDDPALDATVHVDDTVKQSLPF